MLKSLALSSLLFTLGLCQKSQTLYGQCGGRDYDGPHACPSAAYCVTDGNEFYSQCLPAAVVDAEASAAREAAKSASLSGSKADHTTTRVIYTGGAPVISTFVTIITEAPRPPQPPPPPSVVITLTPDRPIWPHASNSTAAPS